MIKRKTKFISLTIAILLILSQGIVFAEDDNNAVVEISVEGSETDLYLSLDDLMNMPEEALIDEEYIYNSKGGEKSVMVKGVSLAYLLEQKGIEASDLSVIFTASDGYPIDPQPLSDILNPDLKYVLAYEVDGESIDNDDNPDNEEIVVYRKLKEEGEFGTVFKLVSEIEIGEDSMDDEYDDEDSDDDGLDDGTEDDMDYDDDSDYDSDYDDDNDHNMVVDLEDFGFTDIAEEYDYAKDGINALANMKVINGMGDNMFAPEGELTRAQFSKIMVLSLGYTESEYMSGFSDVAEGDWFAPYVQTAVDKGIFNGYPDNTFKPDDKISRQEMAVVAGRAAVTAEIVDQVKLDKFVMEKSNYYDKEMVQEWAANEVAWLEAQGVFDDIADDNFNPEKNVNRAEAAYVIYETLFDD